MGDTIDLTDYLGLLKRMRKTKNSTESSALRIAVLGSYSIQHFVGVLRYLLCQNNIDANIYEGNYNGIVMDVFDSDSELYRFKPQIIIIMTYHDDIKVFPKAMDGMEDINELLDIEVGHYKGIWNRLSVLSDCHILQTNFVIPTLREFGNLDNNYLYSKTSYYRMLNLRLIKERASNVNLIDFDYLASNVGKNNWFDNTAYCLNKAGFSIQYIGLAADIFVKQILAYRAKVKKCLVLDLDNTLWGGVVGEEGYDGIELDPNHGIGEAYLGFQKYILGLKRRGIILAICSKNDLETAKEPFYKNENMLIKLEDISCFVANWSDKAENIKVIAETLNIDVNSFVFFDDNPAEREIVSRFLPQVQVIDVPEDPADYAWALEQAGAFEWLALTEEDFKRTESYVNNNKRLELKESFVDYDEYLKSLDMETKAVSVDQRNLERVVQLTNKSNQFNPRTKRYSNQALLTLLDDPDHVCFAVELKDKFENYGIISTIILHKEGDACFIENWVMSCRVIKRNVENFTLEAIKEYAASMGCSRIQGEYIKSEKNSLVKDLYQKLGFISMNGCDSSELELNDSIVYEMALV